MLWGRDSIGNFIVLTIDIFAVGILLTDLFLLGFLEANAAGEEKQ